MKITLEGDCHEIINGMEALINRGKEPGDWLDKIKMYADQAAASAAKANSAARNAEMAAQDIPKLKGGAK